MKKIACPSHPVLRRERHISEHIGLGLVEEAGKLGQLGTKLVGDLPPLCLCGLGIVLGKRGGDEGGDDTAAALAGMRQRVTHEVHAGVVEEVANRFRAMQRSALSWPSRQSSRHGAI
ncbi:hypothetical protein ABIB95_009542, partial [Bradyrhizobium sp. LA2.1]